MDCRLDTKRKIILALGYKLADRAAIFGEEDGEDEAFGQSQAREA
jgi:hypothetical protein